MVSPRHPSTMENLPGEVLSEIFIRLLARQVAQMRCICKSWNGLLSDSSFVKSHLHHSLHNNDRILLLFHTGFLFDDNSITALTTHSPDLEPANFIKVPVNLQSKNGFARSIMVIGSVNGLICFSYKTCREGTVVYIWNPSLSAMLSLPPCSLPSAGEESNFRFGYDPKMDDYKAVKFTCIYGPSSKVLAEVEVYSMRKGSWELITQSFPSHITLIRDYDRVCVDGHDGHLHWLCYTHLKGNAQTIVAFDLGAETFREIPLPNYNHGNWSLVLRVLGGKLCVMSRVEGCKCKVWVMDEYGVAESWVQHQVVSLFGCYKIPYGFTLHSEFLYQDYDRFCLYDPSATQTKTFRITGVSKIVEYVDSLVWVAPAKHELSKSHFSVSMLKSYQLLKGLQKEIKGVSRFLLSGFKRASKGKKPSSSSSRF